MSYRLILFSLVLFSVVSCNKELDYVYDSEHNDDPFYGTSEWVIPISAPCTPTTNSLESNYNGQPINLPFVDITSAYNSQVATWALRGRSNSGGSWEGFYIDFIEAPTTGEYLTVLPAGNQIETDECIVKCNMWVSNTLRSFYANPNDTVYVNEGLPGQYSITFCGLHFEYDSGGEFFEFDSGAANITND